MPDPIPQQLRRRTVLLGGGNLSLVLGVGLAASGCRVRSPLESRPSTEPEPAPVDPDLALRDAARLAMEMQAELVTSTLAARPRLSARLTPLQALHSTHADALPGAPTRAPTTVAAGTWGQVVQGERALQQQLAGMAQRAESGGFARLLASMAAGIGQELAVER